MVIRAYSVAAALLALVCAAPAMPQAVRNPFISVQVRDEHGGVIVGARATLTDSAGHETPAVTDQEGKLLFSDRSPDVYVLEIAAPHFRTYQNRVQVTSGQDVALNVALLVAAINETIAVFPDPSASQIVQYVGGSLVIRGDALLSLSGPGGLEAFLRALALRTNGPFGPSALVNGFEDAELPPTYSIREIRINDDPFSAEYATLGLGRIEILTRPGTEDFHFAAFGNIGDARFNSRNPFATDRIRYESKIFGGNISGPIKSKRATFFFDFNRQQIETNAVINATIVDSAFNIVPLQQAVVTPQIRTSFSPRIDFQTGANNTWVVRYGNTQSDAQNSDVGEFSLPSRAQASDVRVQTFQLTETAVLGSRAINEIRAQYVRTDSMRHGNNSIPVINVPDAFTGGGAEIGAASNLQSLSEIRNVTSWQGERHTLKFGLQGGYTNQLDQTTQNFGGLYTFASRLAPQLGSTNNVVIGADGKPVMEPITTIEAYRRTILFRAQGLSPAAVRNLGGGASQFSITTGISDTPLRRYQAGAFLLDNWRLSTGLTLNTGLRYERQSNDSNSFNFAPRVAMAWGIGGKSRKPTIVRSGFGIFYDRIPDSVVLHATQQDGTRQRQYFVSSGPILDLFPSIPGPAVLAQFAGPQSTVQLANDIRAPYSMNFSVAVEREMRPGWTVAATVSQLRSLHLLRSRNINAPLPETFNPEFPESAVRPFGTSADIFQYESSGKFNQRQLLLNTVYRAGKNVTLWSTYTLSSSKSDSDSPDSFPANGYDLSIDYSRTSAQPRHTVYWGGWIQTRGGIELTPLVLWRSSVPFDITIARDFNGDSIFNDRPGVAVDMTRPSVVQTSYGAFDLNPLPGQPIISRNIGDSPGFFIANLRIAKTLRFGKRDAMTLAIQGTNIFNHTNPGSPVGNLGSALFGRSTSSAGDWGFGSNSAGNRRLEMLLYFSF